MHGRLGINVAAVVCVYRAKLTRLRQTEADAEEVTRTKRTEEGEEGWERRDAAKMVAGVAGGIKTP